MLWKLFYIKVQKNSECPYNTSRNLCAGVNGGGKSVCYGDSGGPLVTAGNGNGVTPGSNYELIGVASYINSLCNNTDKFSSGFARW